MDQELLRATFILTLLGDNYFVGRSPKLLMSVMITERHGKKRTRTSVPLKNEKC